MSEIIRSFMAIELPKELKEQISEYQTKLKLTTEKVKWVQGRSIHITLKFLGDQPSTILNPVIPALMPLTKKFKPFQLTVSGFGAFPVPKKPRVFWLGISSAQQSLLFSLQSWIENALEPLGFEKEKRHFSPHLTIGRIKFPEPFDDLWDYIKKNPLPSFTFDVNELVLMRSILKPQGAQYTPIQKYSLQG